MKRVIQLLSFLIWVFLIYVAFLNNNTKIDFVFLPNTEAVSINIAYVLLTYILGGLTAMSLAYSVQVATLKDIIKKKERTVEKSSITSEESQDKVQLLESKIQTLEKALDEALKHNS